MPGGGASGQPANSSATRAGSAERRGSTGYADGGDARADAGAAGAHSRAPPPAPSPTACRNTADRRQQPSSSSTDCCWKNSIGHRQWTAGNTFHIRIVHCTPRGEDDRFPKRV